VKILHLVQKPQLRGAEMFASQLASHMNQQGHEAILVFVFPGNAPLPFTGKMLHLDGNAKSRLWDIKAWRKLAQIIKEEKPDIIQANAGDTLKYAVFSKILFRWKQPLVFRNASTISLYIKSTPAKLWNGFLFRFAQKVISVSNVSATDFGSLFPKFKNRVTTIPGGIETGEIKNGSATSHSNGLVLMHVGGFTFEKNHIRLIHIFENVLKKNPAASLHLAGNGPLKEQVEEVVRQKGLTDKVVFYGFRNDALQLIQGADVLLLPSIIEGLPGVILEAFYCKTPVVAYDVGGIKEILKNDETGRLVPKGNEELFANEVLAATADTTTNQQLVENAYKLVTTQYLNSSIAKRFIDAYQSVLS
jgi:L-malate glycosyltransferase